ncbi:MAG: GntR family transcriptional regulator [Clostridiaceae bacterium]
MENDLHEAKYAQVKAQLLHMIRDENRFPDRCLPSERELCELFGVSRITIRRAVADLELDGVLFRVQGKGAFVNAAKIQQPLLRVSSFSQDMSNRQMKAGSRILALERIPSGEVIAAKLGISPTEDVYMLKRLRLADDEPMAIETCYLPLKIGAVIAEKIADNMSLYQLMQTACGVTITRASETIEVSRLKNYERKLLVCESVPYAMHFTRRSFDASGQCVEYVESKYRADRYRLITEL